RKRARRHGTAARRDRARAARGRLPRAALAVPRGPDSVRRRTGSLHQDGERDVALLPLAQLLGADEEGDLGAQLVLARLLADERHLELDALRLGGFRIRTSEL